MARRLHQEAELKAFKADFVTFQLNAAPIEKVNTYLYLGCILAYNNSDWPTLYRNFRNKAQAWWAMIVHVLDKEGASPRAKGLFYELIVQSVLLYSCETWTLTETMIQVLNGFHHRVARRLTNTTPWKVHGTWAYSPTTLAMKEAGLHSIKHYMAVQQNHMAAHIAERLIYDLCLQSQPKHGSSPRVSRYWQRQWDFDPPEEPNNAPNVDNDDEDSSYVPSSSSSDNKLDINNDNPSSSSSSSIS
jgi:hypothetical protein